RFFTIRLRVLARIAFVIASAISVTTAASPAAEKLFQDGRSALAAGQIDAACTAFRGSQELEPRVGTLLNLADCEERRHRTATAWATFVEAQTLAKQLNDARAAEAERRAASLAPRLGSMKVVVAAPSRVAGLTIRRDGDIVAQAEWDRQVPLDAKQYGIDVVAPGRKRWRTEVTIVDG